MSAYIASAFLAFRLLFAPAPFACAGQKPKPENRVSHLSIGKTTPLEDKLNIDLIGRFTKSHLDDISSVFVRLYDKFPKAKEIDIKIFNNSFEGDKEKTLGGLAMINSCSPLEDIRDAKSQKELEKYYSCQDQAQRNNIIVLYDKHDTQTGRYRHVDYSYKGRLVHELGHHLMLRNKAWLLGLMKKIISVDAEAYEHFRRLSARYRSPVWYEYYRFYSTYKHLPGGVSVWAIASGDTKEHTIILPILKYSLKKETTLLESRTLLEFCSSQKKKDIPGCKTLNSYLDDLREETAELFTHSFLGYNNPDDAWVKKKEAIISDYLSKIWK